MVEANCQGQTQEQTGARHSSPRQSDDEQHLTPNSCVKIYQYCRSDFDRFSCDHCPVCSSTRVLETGKPPATSLWPGVFEFSIPYGIRTRAATLRGWSPRPLDERDLVLSALPQGRCCGPDDSSRPSTFTPENAPLETARSSWTTTRNRSQFQLKWLGREDLNPQRQYQKLLCYQLHHAPPMSRSDPRRDHCDRCGC